MELSNAVVVGVDGSSSSVGAAKWAAQEAACHGVGLHIASAVTMPPLPAATGRKTYEAIRDSLHVEAETHLSVAASRAHTVAPGIEVSSAVMAGEALHVLVALSRSASLVVVGHRGLGKFAGLLLGSVALHLTAHAHCPVLVWRGTPNPSGSVVVTVDGSPANSAAIAFAFAEASPGDADLVAVHVWSEWSVPPTPPRDKSQAYARKPGELENEEETLLAEALSGMGEKYPDVRVEHRTLHGRTRQELIDASRVVSPPRTSDGLPGVLFE